MIGNCCNFDYGRGISIVSWLLSTGLCCFRCSVNKMVPTIDKQKFQFHLGVSTTFFSFLFFFFFYHIEFFDSLFECSPAVLTLKQLWIGESTHEIVPRFDKHREGLRPVPSIHPVISTTINCRRDLDWRNQLWNAWLVSMTSHQSWSEVDSNCRCRINELCRNSPALRAQSEWNFLNAIDM